MFLRNSACISAAMVICACALPLSAGEPIIGVRVLGGREFIQIERVAIPEIDDSSRIISEAAGRLSIAYRAIFGPPGDVHWRIEFRQFDEWNRPITAPLDVDPATSEFAAYPSIGSFGEFACVSWNKSGAMRARVFDGNGAPVTEPFIVTANVEDVYSVPHILMDEGRIVFTLSAKIAGQRGIFVRVFGYDGLPITEQIPVAASAAGAPRENAKTVFLTDGGLSVCFTRGSGSPDPRYPFLSYLSADYVVVNTTQLLTVSSSYNGFGALDDGSVAIILRTLDEAPIGYVNRFDIFGEPSGIAAQLDPGTLLKVTRIRSDGRFILTYRISNNQLVAGRLYGGDWAPEMEEFLLPLIPTSPQDDFGTIQSSPGLIADNGDAWFTWDNSTFPRQAHLAVLKPLLRGDMNNDKSVNNFDIDAFVLALTDMSAFEAQYGIPQAAAVIIGDINSDGLLNNFDIDPFVALLAGG